MYFVVQTFILGIFKRGLTNYIFWAQSKETGIRVLNDAPLAVFFHGLVPVYGYLTILYVEQLQTPAVVGDQLYAAVRDQVAVPKAKLLQVWTAFGQCA